MRESMGTSYQSQSGLWICSLEAKAMRWVAIVALVLGSVPAKAQVWEQSDKCQTACKSTLDQCSAFSNKNMATALKEAEPYRIDSAAREKADIKFENAFQAAAKCWDRFYRCTGNCRPPKGCIEACQSIFKQCFAAGEQTAKDGLREMKNFKFASPEWKAAYAKGDKEIDHCLADNRDCQGKCAKP
jgi:hypothetical protein